MTSLNFPRPLRTIMPKNLPILIFLLFVVVGIVTAALAEPILLLNFTYIGGMFALGLHWSQHASKRNKNRGRRFTQLTVGLYMLLFLGLFARQNMQIEGLWFWLLEGAFAGAVIHYSVSKVFGPLIIGRSWCGWTCWTSMVLDTLPFKRSPGRVPGKWGWVRYIHFALSLGVVLLLWHGLSYHPDMHGWSLDMLLWLSVGNLLYYGVAIGLAYALKDNRAFCKYLCPVTVPMKLGARFSLLKVEGDASLCNNCDACSKLCPMDVKVQKYVLDGERVASSECILCSRCVQTCPKGALKLSLGLDGIHSQDQVRQQPTR